jgi:hypothetical protein
MPNAHSQGGPFLELERSLPSEASQFTAKGLEGYPLGATVDRTAWRSHT